MYYTWKQRLFSLQCILFQKMKEYGQIKDFLVPRRPAMGKAMVLITLELFGLSTEFVLMH